MKKYFILLFLFLTALNSYSQLDKGSIIIALEGNYSNTSNKNGVTTNTTETDGKYLEVGTSIGLFLTDRIVAGFGFEYKWAKESRFNELYFNNFFQAEYMNLTSKFPSPNLFIGYYYPIINKLYFNTNLKISYGKISTDYSTIYSGVENNSNSNNPDFELGDNSNNYIQSSENKYEYDYFSSKIQPALTYFISNRLGLTISLGGIEYSMLDWKNNTSDWIVNFDPAYWSFGVEFKI